MTTLRSFRRTAAAALFLAAVVVPAVPSATAVTAPHTTAPSATAPQTILPGDVLEPPVSVDALPAQVKKACAIWKKLAWPEADRPTDYKVAGTSYVIRGSNRYGNRSGDLPLDGKYREYDVNPRPAGQHRDAERVVRNPATHAVWYTGDHYDNFRRISSGCS
ncbi:ribonuclease domain-containing protein [Streptomyces sp. NPDC088725]|uniref:ribonuclease domain-containing protein n=1 Tax=Streptomyces sp. NPDC088725 TaxID=3365873 RepID=UPI00380720A6